jgi:GDP-4-dehydro-6-deoxy-D-mannose reductase
MKTLTSISPSRLVITGRTGFVGNAFCSRYGGVSLADETGRVDLKDAARVQSAVASLQPDAVLHLAAQSSVASSFADPEGTFATNFQGTSNLLQALKSIQFGGVFVYVSSAEVYGSVDASDLPLKEFHSLKPLSPYAASKVATEDMCLQYSETESFRIVIARPFNQIGEGQDERFAIANFARQIIEMKHGRKEPVMITGDLSITRDFTDVLDTIDAYKDILERGRNGEIYNICSGRERSLKSLVDGMLQIAGVRASFQVDPVRLRASEQMRIVGDPSKIYEQLGWKPKRNIEETLKDILSGVERN